jgi:hypothetical protein
VSSSRTILAIVCVAGVLCAACSEAAPAPDVVTVRSYATTIPLDLPFTSTATFPGASSSSCSATLHFTLGLTLLVEPQSDSRVRGNADLTGNAPFVADPITCWAHHVVPASCVISGDAAHLACNGQSIDTAQVDDRTVNGPLQAGGIEIDTEFVAINAVLAGDSVVGSATFHFSGQGTLKTTGGATVVVHTNAPAVTKAVRLY